MRAALAALLLLAGCTQTGMVLEVSAAATPSVQSLQFVTAHRSWCERWVMDAEASATPPIDVGGRDLTKSPYQLYVHPGHFTDLAAPVYSVAVGLDASGQPVGFASFGAHPFRHDKVDQYSARLEPLARVGGPSYLAGDGRCLCLPGEPWIGDGAGSACDGRVVTSFDRLIDTAGCELTAGARELAGPVCDGQSYLDEAMDRKLPCFAAAPSGCAVDVRNCHDGDGRAYDEECTPDATAPQLPTGALCDAYLACQRTACGDVIGCFTQSVPRAATLTCTLRVDPTTDAGQPLKPCADGKWEATFASQLTGAACVASVLEGVSQGPLTLGFSDGAGGAAQPVSTHCQPVFRIDSVGADVKPSHELDVTVGDKLFHVTLHLVRACAQTAPSLSCTSG